MNNELIIKSTTEEVVIALLQDKHLIELNSEQRNNRYAVGDIYLGRVKKVMPGLNAAFVDVGHEKDAFLHYLDLGAHYNYFKNHINQALSNAKSSASLDDITLDSEIDKGGKISDLLSANQKILVQITKEPISTKGPRVSCEITLAGRYMVLIPFSEKVFVSQKLESSAERERLKRLIHSIKPKNFGVIVRTASENQKVAELNGDIKDLVSKWNSCFEKLKYSEPPQKVLGELQRSSAILRDILNPDFSSINVNDVTIYEEIKRYLLTIAPDKEKIVKMYYGKDPIFEYFGVEKQIKALFGKFVTMKSRAYLIIEHTEALHVIDVNSGNRKNTGSNQEQNALDVNLEAAEEIARQLRMRDMGGIIVVDFIDMYKAENRKLVYQKLKEAMNSDRAKHKLLPLSRFGLMQITRQRVRPAMDIVTIEKCPSCNGSGEIKSTVLLMDEIENNLSYFLVEQNEPLLTLCVHPFIEAYLTKGIFSVSRKWMLKYKKRIKIKADSSFHFLEYRFFNKNEEEIKI